MAPCALGSSTRLLFLLPSFPSPPPPRFNTLILIPRSRLTGLPAQLAAPRTDLHTGPASRLVGSDVAATNESELDIEEKAENEK